jgi:hypothetical protein
MTVTTSSQTSGYSVPSCSCPARCLRDDRAVAPKLYRAADKARAPSTGAASAHSTPRTQSRGTCKPCLPPRSWRRPVASGGERPASSKLSTPPGQQPGAGAAAMHWRDNFFGTEERTALSFVRRVRGPGREGCSAVPALSQPVCARDKRHAVRASRPPGSAAWVRRRLAGTDTRVPPPLCVLSTLAAGGDALRGRVRGLRHPHEAVW